MPPIGQRAKAQRKDMVFMAICLALAIGSYEITNWLPRQADLISLATPVDNAWPLMPIFVIPYLSFIPIVFLFVPWLLAKDRLAFRQYGLALLVTQLVLDVLYFVVPATVLRPVLKVTDAFSWLLSDLVWKLDNPVNTFPSNHVAFSTIAAIFIFRSTLDRNWIIFAELWFAAISVSTLFTHQHVLADAIAGMAISTTVVYFDRRFYLETKLG
jgi:membrane-associated phospholipid phosphatase